MFKKQAAIWWEGIRTTILTWDDAISAIKNAYAPPMKNYQIYTKVIEEKQIENETTENYVCRQRALIARLNVQHNEITQMDLVYGGLHLFIRKDMPRNSVATFMELTTRSKIIEEHQSETNNKRLTKYCSNCSMRNHNTSECRRKKAASDQSLPSESMDTEEKSPVVTIKCYGCGKPGFIRSNCPNCKQIVQAASIDIDISHITLTFDTPIPTVPCKINGLAESAHLDTAAKTSIASDSLFQRMKENGCQFELKIARIKQADGKIKHEIIKLIQAVIEIHNRFFNINFVVLSDTDKNRTLLGIDFWHRQV